MFDVYRLLSRGQYINDFSFLNYGSTFPTMEIVGRNAVYSFRHKQYTGEYAYNKKLVCSIDGVNQEIEYQVIGLNYFQLMTEKLTDIVFNNDISIKTGDLDTDEQVQALVEKTDWKNSIRRAFKKCSIYGDAALKVHKNGVSVINPQNVLKVIDIHDTSNVIGYVLYEPIYVHNNKVLQLRYIRFEVHIKGKIYECARTFIGSYGSGTIGRPVELKYRGRTISQMGDWYGTGIDECELVQWLSINTEADGVYGESPYAIVQPIIFELEQRLSVQNSLLDSSMRPFLVVGIDAVETYVNEKTGRDERRLKLINGQFLVSDGADAKPVELNYNLDNSTEMIGMLRGFLYELSEMSQTFMTGTYSGNVSEETLQNTMKSVLDKANRYISEIYGQVVNSLYCLCILNGIKVSREDLTVDFNLGQIDSDEKIAEVSKLLVENNILSRRTIREKYFGYTAPQSDSEEEQIKRENEPSSKHYTDTVEKDDMVEITEVNSDDIEEKESNTEVDSKNI